MDSSESKPKPRSMVFNPNFFKHWNYRYILATTGIGVLPKVVSIAFLAARYAGKSVGITTPPHDEGLRNIFRGNFFKWHK